MRIGPYEVTARLGEGGAGVVFAARGPAGDEVALKLLRQATPDALARFERESRLQAQLGDVAGFVPILEVGRSPQGPYLVMPLLRGGTLRRRLEGRPLPTDAALDLVIPLAHALGLAHARGIVHRDLKPENVLFDERGRAFLADLGLAKHFTADTPGASRSVSLSQAGALRGTAGYMAPEQAEDARSAGPPADVFALGAILYECLAGHPAFSGESPLEVIARVAEGEVEPLEGPPWLAAIVERALDPDPARRFEDAEALARALEAGPVSTKPPSAGLPGKLALAAVLLIIISVALAFAVTFRHAPPVLPEPRPPAKPDAAPATSRTAPTPPPGRPEPDAAYVARLRKGAESGSLDDMVELGLALIEGRQVRRAPAQGVAWLTSAAERGSPRGMGSLGVSYLKGDGVKKDAALAARWIEKGARAGDPESMVNLGALLLDGLGVEKDEPAAVEWIRKAADLGCARGMTALGVVYGLGRGVIPDGKEAVRWLRRGAEKGDPEGMAQLGVALRDGLGEARDDREAVGWLRKSAEGGWPAAMSDLGLMLSQGRGVKKDEAEAVRWFRRAAEAGDASGMHNLAVCLSGGLGVSRDDAEAYRWFHSAATAGKVDACMCMGQLCEEGRGTEKDVAQAIEWYMEAAKRGAKGAHEALHRLGAE
ncbi:MAG TPA: serine/threonine-protein kinase [Planctomycetota bacterium]|nr:serine/threonine-protein kinase [Planctomycetota bacterium]